MARRRLPVALLLLGASLVLAGVGVEGNGSGPGESRDGLAAHPLPNGRASEYWDLTARFESGHLLLVRFVISNVGPGSNNAAASWLLAMPDGPIYRFHNGRPSGRWSLSSDSLRIEIGSSLFDQHGPAQRLLFDKKKGRIDLAFHETGPVRRLDLGAPGYAVELLAASTGVEGTIWVRGMERPLRVRGQVGVTHTRLPDRESELELRRVEFFTLGTEEAAYLLTSFAPSGVRRHWAVVTRGPELLHESSELQLCALRETDASYPLLQGLRIRNEMLRGQVEEARVAVEHDPMSEVPNPFRWWLERHTKPLRRWSPSPYRLTLATPAGGRSLQLHGTGVQVVSYTNPVPDRARNGASGGLETCALESAS